MTEDDVRSELKRMCEMRDSQKAIAAELGVSAQYVTDVLAARRSPGKTMLKAMGLRKVVSYEREDN